MRDSEKKNTIQPGEDKTIPTASFLPGAPVPGGQIGPYKLLSILGEGGYGMVYLAEQQKPVRRRVALKVIKPGMDTKEVIARFEAERQALALLTHPNIAQVYTAETTEAGRPYFVMEYVKGVPIIEYCDTEKLKVEQRLKLFMQVCEGVQHAHQKGIIHRDIKPSNILVSVEADKAIPKIIDFGVAKALSQPLTDRTLYTEQGQFIGTPEYMSPEQAEMTHQDVDTRADIYSLGVVFYELLTGVLPFDAKTLREGGVDHIRRIIREEEPKTPSTKLSTLSGEDSTNVAKYRDIDLRSLQQKLRGDLDWITLKTLEKDRTRRYGSVGEFIADINRHLNNEPILARPPSTLYKIQKFVRRNRTVFFALAAVAVILVLATVISVVFAIRAGIARDSEAKQRIAAEKAEREAENARDVAEEEKQKALTAFQNLQKSNYIANIRLADHYIRTNYSYMAKSALDKCDKGLRNWEWHYLNNITDTSILTLPGHIGGVLSVVFSPDGKQIISGGRDQTVKIWDAQSGKELRILKGHENWVTSVAISTDGKRIVSCSLDKNVKIWEVESSKELMTLKGHQGGVESVVISPDGKWIISGGDNADKTIKMWDAESGKEIRSLIGHQGGVRSMAFSPGGKLIISGSLDKTIKIWDTESGKELRTLRGHKRGINAIALSPDGKRIISGGEDQTIKIWDAESGEEVRTLRGHQSWVISVAISPDGKRIVSGDGDNCTIKIWDAESGEELRTLRGHNSWVTSVAISPDGKRIISGGDNTIRIWDAESDQERRILKGHEGGVTSVAFSPDGKRIISGARDKTIKIWDVKSGKELRSLLGHEDGIRSIAIRPDGKRIVSGGDNTVKMWDAESGKELRILTGHKGPVTSLTFSPDGRRIISAPWGNSITIWDAESGKELKTFGDAILSLAVSPDGKRIISGGGGGGGDYSIKIWDAESGKELRTLKGQGSQVNSVALSPDGKWFISGTWDKTIKIWNAESYEELRTLKGHGGSISSLAISPGGKRIISSSSWDKTVKIWDTESGEELMSLYKGENSGNSVAISPDGNRIISGHSDGTILIWEIQSDGSD